MISITRSDARPVSLREASSLLQSFAHPIRLQILDALRDGDATVGDIVDRLGLPQPVVSRHLAILRRAGAVRGAAHGRVRRYRVADPRTARLMAVLFYPPCPASADGAPLPS